MGRPKKDLVLGEETVVETPETVEEVTAEVVGSDESAEAQEIKKLKAELAEKSKQLDVLGEGSQKRVRDKVKKIIPGGDAISGTITIYEMK